MWFTVLPTLLALHLLLVLSVSCRETFWLIREGLTILPAGARPVAQTAEAALASALGRNLPTEQVAKRALATYLNGAGTETGYGFFAPNVPGGYKLVLELHYHDGRVAYDSPGVSGQEGSLRFASLLDYIGRTSSHLEREVLLKLLANASWRQHPGSTKIHAVLGEIVPPTAAERRSGQRAPTYRFVAEHDFAFARPDGEGQPPSP